MPTVTQDTADEDAMRRCAPDPAARVRRLITSTPNGAAAPEPARSGAEPDAVHPDAVRPDAAHPGAELLSAALARFDAPVDLRVRGGLGSGRRTLAAALRARRGWRVTVEDLDVLAAPGAPPAAAPDVEIICLRTAPCRHEEAWARRPRVHPMLIVATELVATERDDDDNNNTGTGTGTSHSGSDSGGSSGDVSRPRWARGLPAVDARSPEDRSVDTVVRFVERALDALASVRVARLEAELERLAVHPEVGELAEAALCALDQ